MPFITAEAVPPVAPLLAVTGLAVWAEGLYFLGAGSKPRHHLGHGMTPTPAEHASPSVARGAGAPPDTQVKAGATDAAAAAAPVQQPPRLTDPVRAVGMIMFIAGIMDLITVWYIISGEPIETPVTTVLASMVVIPAAWFCYLGISQVLNLDMRPVGNVAVPVGLVPILFWQFFSTSIMIQIDLWIWGIAFWLCTIHSYGKLPDKVLGAYLVFTAIVAFFLQPVMWSWGIRFPFS